MHPNSQRLLLGLVLLAACESAPTPPAAPALEAPARSLSSAGIAYPLHAYSDPTDGWAYLTPTQPVYVELRASDQTPHPDDGPGKRRVCPNDQWIERNAHLRMNHGLETIDLDFRGPFTFLRHVSTASPYPTAAYRFNRNAYSHDDKYYAPAGGQVLLACDGNYVLNNGLIRLWVGYLYGKGYTGDIVRNPDYQDPGASEGGCEDGIGEPGDQPDLPYTSHSYDPYTPESEGGAGECSGGSGGEAGTQYEPGDYTGGQTVEWGTGIGNGGESACGKDARVERICIDVWNPETQRWEEWSCGYATTC